MDLLVLKSNGNAYASIYRSRIVIVTKGYSVAMCFAIDDPSNGAGLLYPQILVRGWSHSHIPVLYTYYAGYTLRFEAIRSQLKPFHYQVAYFLWGRLDVMP